MNTQEQAYINGFVKRASEYGFSYNEAISLLKQSALTGDQHKLDVNHDGKIEASDLKALRNRKKNEKTAGPVPEMDTQPGGRSFRDPLPPVTPANRPVPSSNTPGVPAVSLAALDSRNKVRK